MQRLHSAMTSLPHRTVLPSKSSYATSYSSTYKHSYSLPSRDPKRLTSDLSTVSVQYLKNSWMLFSNYTVRCESVWSSILTTAWLLVDWSTHVTNTQTDEQATVVCKACMLSCAENCYVGECQQRDITAAGPLCRLLPSYSSTHLCHSEATY